MPHHPVRFPNNNNQTIKDVLDAVEGDYVCNAVRNGCGLFLYQAIDRGGFLTIPLSGAAGGDFQPFPGDTGGLIWIRLVYFGGTPPGSNTNDYCQGGTLTHKTLFGQWGLQDAFGPRTAVQVTVGTIGFFDAGSCEIQIQ